MNEQVTLQVDKQLADAIVVVQILRDCGMVDVNSDTASFSNMWSILDAREKALISAMIKGSVATAGAIKQLQKQEQEVIS